MPKKSAKKTGAVVEAVKINPIEKYIKPVATSHIALEVGEDKIDVAVKNRLTLSEVAIFIGDVVNTVVDPEFVTMFTKDFAIGFNTIVHYTDIEMPENVEDQYSLIYGTDIIERILEKVNSEQYLDIRDAIDKQIDYEIQRNLNDLRREAQQIIESFKAVEDIFSGITPDQIKGIIPALAKGMDEKKVVDAVVGKIAKKTKGKDGKVIEMKTDG